MLEFIESHHQSINVFINAAMLLVWAFYFQMLFNSHRRGMRAKLLINRSAGHDLGAQCVISNMSAEAVYLEAVVMFLRLEETIHECSLTDLENLTRAPEGDARTHWFQGPLKPGEFITLGSFENLIQTCAEHDSFDVSALKEFDFLVVATYGPDSAPVGAQRTFRIDRQSTGGFRWRAGHTQQLRSFWRRRGLQRYLRESG